MTKETRSQVPPLVCVPPGTTGLMDRDYSSYDDVPYHSRWRHFEAGGLDRTARLTAAWDGSKSCDELGGNPYNRTQNRMYFLVF